MNYLNRKRIEVCKELLENTDYGISDIAHLTGFSSQSYLSQSFRKSCGMTAGTYRKLKKKKKGSYLISCNTHFQTTIKNFPALQEPVRIPAAQMADRN